MKSRLAVAIGAALIAGPLIASAAAPGERILETQCASCHALTVPQGGVDHLWARKGPDLHYAGSKFNQSWLVSWLQAPTRIRPAGELYFRHVKATSAEDVVDETTLSAHPALARADAEAAAAALMTRLVADIVPKGAFKHEKVSMTMGRLFFTKLRGCGACHMDKPGNGGQSGPELYTAGDRLQADFIYSYIKDPQKFDARVWMPKLNFSDPDLQRLTGYIVQLSAPEAK